MREIKFRAWDKEENKLSEVRKIEITMDGKIDAITFENGLTGNNYNFNRFELQQFTGLKDKNGKEIYEGDIVNTTARGICEIIWNENENAFRLGKYNEMPLSILTLEVIGNIFENPELINKP